MPTVTRLLSGSKLRQKRERQGFEAPSSRPRTISRHDHRSTSHTSARTALREHSRTNSTLKKSTWWAFLTA